MKLIPITQIEREAMQKFTKRHNAKVASKQQDDYISKFFFIFLASLMIVYNFLMHAAN